MPARLHNLILTAVFVYLVAAQASDVFHITSKPQKVPSSVQFTYPGTGLDCPKVRPVNTTTFDWWYFDAVSSDLASGDLSSVVVTFYDATAGGFEALSKTNTKLEVSITGSFSDGTPFSIDSFPSEANVTTYGDNAEGQWGKYASWTSTPDLKYWTIAFQDQRQGVSGSMTLESVRAYFLEIP